MAVNPRNVARALRPLTKAAPGGARPTAAPQMGQPYAGGISPLAMESQAGGGTWANAYGGFLPRPPQDFTQGAFGPFSPILPVPVDSPPSDDTPRAEPRLWQYEVGYNLPVGQPGTEGLKLADFGTLKTLADLYSVARACIQLRKSEVRGLEWDITPTKEASKAMRNDKAAMRDFGARRGEAVKFFNHPDPDFFTWNTWLDALLEQVFVFDALALLLQPKWSRGTGKGLLGSDLDSLQLISGPTIRPLVDMRGAKPRPPAPAYQQYLYGVPRSDLMTVATNRDIDEAGLTGAEWAQFRGDHMLYIPMVPRRETPYGFPPIERALIPVMAGLQKQAFQLDFFREGSVPAVYISPGGVNSDLTPNQIRELQDALNAIAGDPAYKHKILVLPADSKVMPQKPVEIADQFDEIVMNQVCMAFDVQPMELGISPKVSSTQSPGAANQMAKSSSQTHERKATKPLLKFLADIFDYILHDVCGQEDMQFTFEGLEEGEDEETKTSLLVTQISAGLASIDEGREALGRQPWGTPQSSDPFWAGAAAPLPLEQIGQQPPALPGAPGAPAKPGTAKPGGGNTTPGHAAAAASDTEAGRPSSGSTKTPVSAQKAAAADATEQRQEPPQDGSALRDAVVAAAVVAVLARLRDLVRQFHGDRTAAAVALQGAVDAMAHGYGSVMGAASEHAVGEHGGTAQDFSGSAATRAETQRAFLMGMLKTAAEDDSDDPAWVDARTKLYGNTLNAAYNEAYGRTVQANHPNYEIIWRLGETEHCPLCLARDGKSYTFDTLPGYPGDGGFGGADALCLGGPNCFPAGTRVQAADVELGYKRWYEGDLVEIMTADGHTISGTPNHPVLTCNGWVALGLLNEGDHLIRAALDESTAVDPYVQAVPAGIEEVVHALANIGPAVRLPVLPVHFHGDGVGDGEVEIVGSDCELSPYGNTTSGKPLRKFVLTGADMGHEAFAGLRHADGFQFGPAAAAPRGVRGGDLGGALLGSHSVPDGASDTRSNFPHTGVGVGGQPLALVSGGIPVAGGTGFFGATDRDAIFPHDGLNEPHGASDLVSEGLGALSVGVAVDKVLYVQRRPFAGHVYNLQTASGWYIANGIIVHNCGCHLEYKEAGAPSVFGDNTQRPASVQYYQDQLSTIQDARARAAQERTDFVDSLPSTGAQARALNRDQIRRLLADEANAAIRARGGYPGVSVEPADIPADMIIQHPLWMKSRAARAELEALARHLRKGRLISTWEPRHLPHAVLARIAEHMAHGLDADTAVSVVKATRRVSLDGEEYWDTDPATDLDETAAGGGGRVPGGSVGRTPGGEPPRWDSDGGMVAPYMDMWPQGGHGSAQPGASSVTAGSVRGRSPNGVGKDAEPGISKVGPHGYIHGWIKVNPGGDSLQMHSDEHGDLKPERAKLHDSIVEGMLAGHESKAKPTATFLGGGPASGKSTVMKDTESTAIVDADGIKAKLPEYQHMVEDKDPRAAAFAHEESSAIAGKAMREAAKRKIDFTLDGTGDSSFAKLSKKVEQARASGHSIAAKYVTVDTDEAVRRAMLRAQKTGRMVPETTIREIHASVSDAFKKAIDHNLFDTAELWDNNGKEPRLIGEKKAGGSWTVHDQGAWQSFLDKGKES